MKKTLMISQFDKTLLAVILVGLSFNAKSQCTLSNGGSATAINTTYWTQSFTATCNGYLQSVTVNVVDQTFTGFTVFEGDGCTGTTLGTQSISCGAGSCVVNLTSNVAITNNSVYSFQFQSSSTSATLSYANSNTYGGGTMRVNQTCVAQSRDINFSVSISATVLPIELLNFKATPSVSSIKLAWETANEVNNKGFQIERLMDNGQWTILGFVSAKSKSSSYEFVDNAPLSINYYRLRQIDNDGKETLSKVVSASLKGKNVLKAYPSVSTGLLTLETSETGDFQIFNLLGQQVLSGNTTPQINVSALPQGTYLIKVGTEQAKFVKQ